MDGVLSQLKVLDLSRGIAGPMATMLLADHGARVTRIEPPGGDPLAVQPGYRVWNRGKRSAVLDLKQAADREVLLALVREADVLVESYRPGVTARLGIDHATLSALNPRLVYCSITAYGTDTRHADRPGYDALVAARTGLHWEQRGWPEGAVNHMLGIPDPFADFEVPADYLQGAPRPGPLFVASHWPSLGACFSATTGISAALYARERTGRGQAIEVPMFETMTQFVLSDHMYGQTFDPPLADAGYVRLLAKDRRPCRTRDGFICVLIYIDKHWKNFCEMLGRQDMLQDPRFLHMSDRTRNVDALYAFVTEQIAQRTTAEWMEALARADIPAAPMHTPATLMDDPHLADVGLFQWIEHPSEGRIRSMGVPGTWSGTPPAVRLHAPLLGENTREVLAQAGYSPMEIERLLGSGAARAQEARPETNA